MSMVFGNMGEDSATGVAFTRDPSTGEQGLYGEFLLNAQGEDVVAGIRTPRPLEEMEEAMPHAFEELLETMQRLEQQYRDMQDVEFTVERDNLYMLQTRSGKRTGVAALKVAYDMAEEGLISREEAVSAHRARPAQPGPPPLHRPRGRLRGPGYGPAGFARGGHGRDRLTADEAEEKGEAGEAVILVRKETNPDDVHGMVRARGILTALGGMTSHAAVVARGFGKPAVTGCKAIEIDPEAGEVSVDGKTFKAGDTITIEGSSGRVVEGEVPLIDAELSRGLRADSRRGPTSCGP